MKMSHGKEKSKKKPHFCKFFLPGVTDRTLSIPRVFLKYLKHEAHGRVSLMNSNGKHWHVDMVNNVNEFFFHDGWKEFTRDHNLKFGDFLVFRYDGNLHFTVQIFGRTGCEKREFFYVEPSEESRSIEAYNEIMKVKKDVYAEQNRSRRYWTRSSHRLLFKKSDIPIQRGKKNLPQQSLCKRSASATRNLRGQSNSSYPTKNNQLASRGPLFKKLASYAKDAESLSDGVILVTSSAEDAESSSDGAITEIQSSCQRKAVKKSLVTVQSSRRTSRKKSINQVQSNSWPLHVARQ